MTKIKVIAILVLFFFSCGKTEKVITSGTQIELKPMVDENTKGQVKTTLFGSHIELESSFDKTSLRKIESIPQGAYFKGKLIDAYTWFDQNGENLLVNSEKIWEEQDENDYTVLSGTIYSVHYLKTDSGFFSLVETVDRINACDLDLTIKFKAPPIIQDVDVDGIAEVIIIYIKTCRGDVSPATLKVLMHEGTDKYGLRGQEFLAFTKDFFIPEGFEYNLESFEKSGKQMKDGFVEDGRYINNKDFNTAPESFFKACEKAWIENVEYKMY